MSEQQAEHDGRRLAGRRVVVFGGTSGIGLATAQAAAASGAAVVIVGRDRSRLDAALDACPGSQGHTADVTDQAAIEALLADLGTIDHVVSTAGGRAGGRLVNADLNALREEMDVRFWGAVHVCRAAAPRLRGNGSITLCSGAVSRKPAPGRSVVSAILNGVEGLSRALALELAPIRVNTVIPGIIDSPRLRQAMGTESPVEEQLSKRFAHLPAGRAGALDEIAAAFLFAITNPYLTGHSLLVDGGYTLT